MLELLRRAGAVLLTGAALLLLRAGPALAHGQLAEALPADGSATDRPVDVVTLWFTEAPGPTATFVVTAPDGSQVQAAWRPGEDKVLEVPVQELNRVNGVWTPSFYDTGYGVDVPLTHLPAGGRYSVAYRSVASDGEAVTGTTTFTYRGSPSTPSADRQTSPGGAVDPTVDVPEPTPVTPRTATDPPPARVLAPVAPAEGQAAAPQPSSGGSSATPVLVGGLAVVLAANVGWLAVRRARRSGPASAGPTR